MSEDAQLTWFTPEEEDLLATKECYNRLNVALTYDASEQDKVIAVFTKMLREVTKDGGRKRAAGLKPPWYVDDSHEAAVFSHWNTWKHGIKVDRDSGAHPLVHGAWRMLAIAYIETYGKVEP